MHKEVSQEKTDSHEADKIILIVSLIVRHHSYIHMLMYLYQVYVVAVSLCDD